MQSLLLTSTSHRDKCGPMTIHQCKLWVFFDIYACQLLAREVKNMHNWDVAVHYCAIYSLIRGAECLGAYRKNFFMTFILLTARRFTMFCSFPTIQITGSEPPIQKMQPTSRLY
uniref:Uncharacterized protein n=1 Tax=Rhipicephalus microplus TaxID=6941 RepID=A0A6G5AID7_RHIMP